MMNTRKLSLFLAALACFAMTFCLPAAAVDNMVLGSDDAVYTLVSGPESSFFGETASDAHILVLNINHRDGSNERLRVPGTESDDLESNSVLFSDPVSGAVYVLWESSYDSFSPYARLLLAGFHNGTWNDPILLSLSSIEKDSAQLAITRDDMEIAPVDGGDPTLLHRTVLHLVWMEDGGNGSASVVYSPVFLVDDEFHHLSHPLFLDDLFAQEEAGASSSEPLQKGLLTIHAGEGRHSVVVAGGGTGTQRVFAMEIQVLPGEVSILADGFRDLLLSEDAAGEMTAQARHQIEPRIAGLFDQIGQHLSPAFIVLARQQIDDLLSGGGNFADLAQEGRQRLIDLAGRMQQGGVQKVHDGSRHQWVDVGVRSTPRYIHGGALKSHLVDIRSVSEASVPRLAADRPAELLNSLSGDGLVVHWKTEQKLWYQQSVAGQAWTKATPVELDGEVTADEVIHLLQERLDNR